MKFTDKQIASLKPKDKRYNIWEDNSYGFGNLGIRVFPTGRRSWIFMYRYNNKPKMLTLGQYPEMTVAKAHAAYGDAVRRLDEGYDPATVPLNQRVENKKSKVIEDLSNDYFKNIIKPPDSAPRTCSEYKRVHEHDILPVIGKMMAKAVQKKEIEAILQKVKKRGSPIQANRTFAITRAFFNYLISIDAIEFSPCRKLKMPSTELRRERVLRDNELVSFLNKLANAKMSDVSRNALKLQLYTAQRPGEVLNLEWADLDFGSKWWNMPPEKAKNKQGHEVPLTDQSLAILRDEREIAGDSRWVFPSPRYEGKNHMRETALARALSRNLDVLGIEHFTPHDLRRTAASHIASLGFPEHVLKKILNHKDRQVTAIYNRYDYAPEKREALEAWNAKLDKLLAEAQKKEQENGEA